MYGRNYEGSFLATLTLKDGTPLGFYKIVDGGNTNEAHDYLCANSMCGRLIKIYFQLNDDGGYILSYEGEAPDESLEYRPDELKYESDQSLDVIKKISSSDVVDDAAAVDKNLSSGLSSDEGVQMVSGGQRSAPPATDAQVSGDSSGKPSITSPPLNKAPVYISINSGGWVCKTGGEGSAYIAVIKSADNSAFSIAREDVQAIYLETWGSKRKMQTYKRENFPNKRWFAWMTDCDGEDAVLSLKIIERYNKDGTVKLK